MQPAVPDASAVVPLRFLLGVAAAVLATLAMDAVMARRPEGDTPPTVASGVLTERHPDRAPERLATVVHYLAGALSGGLYVWLLYASEAVLGDGLLATATATVVLYALMVGFFVVVVLPRSRLPAQRLPDVRRDWAIAAGAYVLVLAPVVAVASNLL